MKFKKWTICLAAVAALALSNITASADTVTNAPGSTSSISNALSNAGQTLGQIYTDGQSALSGLNFAQGAKVSILGIKHSKDYGVGIAVTTAITNSLVQAGFAVVGMQEKDVTGNKKISFYDATINLQITKHETLLGVGVDLSIESGPAYDINGGTILEQSAVLASHTFILGTTGNIELCIGGGVMHCSKWSGDTEQLAFIQLTDHMRGTGWLGLW